METETQPERDLEFQLTAEFVELQKQEDELSKSLKEVKEKLAITEAKLMQILDDQNKKATARYAGLGHVTCVDPAPFAQIIEGQEGVLFESLRQIGREDLIKQAVNTRSLTTLVREKLKVNEPIPDGCTYYMKRRLQFFPIK